MENSISFGNLIPFEFRFNRGVLLWASCFWLEFEKAELFGKFK